MKKKKKEKEKRLLENSAFEKWWKLSDPVTMPSILLEDMGLVKILISN
jgi:hypothetical protein